MEECFMGMDDADDVGQWPVIHAYTREEAISDGVLVDVSEMAREAGFRYPVAVTRWVYEECIAVPTDTFGQDTRGRLWDLLVVLSVACRNGSLQDETLFRLLVRNDNREAKGNTLKAVCHAGDAGEPVITVMFPSED
jgi:hypothetical protein